MVVVADSGNHRLTLWRLSNGTVWKTKPGQFAFPKAVAVTRAGALVVTDESRVQVLTVDGAVWCVLDPTAVAGVGRLGENLNAVTMCRDSDEILMTDYHNHCVVALMWSRPSHVRLFLPCFFFFFIFFIFFFKQRFFFISLTKF